MKVRNLLILGAVLLFALPAMAQDDDGKFELSAEFSYIRWNPAKNFSNSANLFGGGGSVSYFFTPMIGIKGELTGYGSQNFTVTVPTEEGNAVFIASGNLFTYLFGPVIKKRSGTFQPYGQVLLGGAHSNVFANLNTNGLVGGSRSGNAFAMAAGAGLDIKLSHSISLRPAEVDYVLTRFQAFNGVGIPPSTHNQNSFRYQAGIVFSF